MNSGFLRSFLLVAIWGLLSLDSAVWAGPTSAEPIELEVRLIWGCNDTSSPNPEHKPLDSALTKWLGKNFRWSNYYEVNKKFVLIPVGKNSKVSLSDKCVVDIKNLGDHRLQLELFGSGKSVNKVTDTLKEWIILAGDDKNQTAWFVVIRKARQNK